MKNGKIAIEGDELIIRINLTKNIGPSKKEKNLMIATTSGNHPLQGFDKELAALGMEDQELVLGLNLYTDLPK